MVNKCTKFKVARFTRYEAMNGSAKCKKWGGFGVDRGQSRSRAMSPFDRAHMTSCSTLNKLCGYLVPFSTYSQLFVKSRRFYPTPPAFGAPAGDDPGGISQRSLAAENYSSWDIVWFYLCDPVFSRFIRTPTCDRHRHRQTQGHSIYRASITLRGKNEKK